MKQLSLIIYTIILFSCKKNTDPAEPTTTITVKEYKTQAPLAGASVTLWRCAAVGCVWDVNFYAATTDVNGTAQIPQSKFNEATQGITIHKTGYWSRRHIQGINYLNPEGWISIRLIKAGNYPPGSYLFLSILEERPGDPYGISNQIQAPGDSTLNIKSYGGQLNTIKWRVTDANSNIIRSDTSLQLQVPKMDTAAITLTY